MGTMQEKEVHAKPDDLNDTLSFFTKKHFNESIHYSTLR